MFWGRTINDLSSLHSLFLDFHSNSPAMRIRWCTHTHTHTNIHAFIQKIKGNSHRKRITKINFEGCFYCFFPHRRFLERDACLGIYFSYSSMRTKCSSCIFTTHIHTYTSHIERTHIVFHSRFVQLGDFSSYDNGSCLIMHANAPQ